MARINPNQLIKHATQFVHLASVANEVQKDPIVRDIWAQSARHCGTAFRSVALAVKETAVVWHRTASIVNPGNFGTAA